MANDVVRAATIASGIATIRSHSTRLMHTGLALLFSTAAVSLAGCSSVPKWITEADRRTAHRVLFIRGVRHDDEFRKLDLETAYAVYRVGMDGSEPPIMMTVEFAERGKDAVDFIKGRLIRNEYPKDD